MMPGQVTFCWTIAAAILIAAIGYGQEPETVPTPDGPAIEGIIKDAVDSGSRVILKRVEYVGGEDTAPEGGAVSDKKVRSKTYIEIETRPAGLDEDEMIESQRKVEESQREMMKAMGVIGKGQESLGDRLGTVEGLGHGMTDGMKSEAREQSGVRGETASTGSEVSDVDRTVQDSNLLLKKIDAQVKSLSGAISELSSRVGEVKDSVGTAADETSRGIEKIRITDVGDSEVSGASELSSGVGEESATDGTAESDTSEDSDSSTSTGEDE